MIVIDYFPGLRFPFTPQMTSQFVFLAQASFLCSRGGSASCPACFPQIKFYWHIAAPIHLHLVGAPFFTYLPRGGLAYEANNAVYRKTLLTLLHTWQPDRHPALALAAPGDTFDAIISNLSSGVQLHQVPRTPSLSTSHMPRRGGSSHHHPLPRATPRPWWPPLPLVPKENPNLTLQPQVFFPEGGRILSPEGSKPSGGPPWL